MLVYIWISPKAKARYSSKYDLHYFMDNWNPGAGFHMQNMFSRIILQLQKFLDFGVQKLILEYIQIMASS